MNGRNVARAAQERIRTDPEGYAPGQKLADWMRDARDEELWRINAYVVADALGADRKKTLATMIRLVKDGVLDLNWDFHCPECNAIAGSHRHLADATAENHCALCSTTFRNTLDRNVEVTFTPSRQLWSPDRRFLEAQKEKAVALYEQKALRMPELFVSGMDCLHVPLFRELFESETLSLRESLRVGQVCIMFTDIKGSTALYERLGDSAAYALIRAHFDILFREVEQYDGVVVKTIGDSVMGSFKRSEDGVAAAIAIQKAFAEFNQRESLRNEILVKIGLHAGSTIMVNLNNRLDYFGQVVNIAARIQGTAAGGDIVISSAIRKDPASIGRMKGRVRGLARRVENLRGITEAQEVFALRFAS